MCKINYILYKYISSKYDCVPNFANISGISQCELNALLLKTNIPESIAFGVKICNFLNLDILKFLQGEVSEISELDATEFKDRYIRLSEVEKKNVDDFISSFVQL